MTDLKNAFEAQEAKGKLWAASHKTELIIGAVCFVLGMLTRLL